MLVRSQRLRRRTAARVTMTLVKWKVKQTRRLWTRVIKIINFCIQIVYHREQRKHALQNSEIPRYSFVDIDSSLDNEQPSMLEHSHTEVTRNCWLFKVVCCCLTADRHYGHAGDDDTGRVNGGADVHLRLSNMTI